MQKHCSVGPLECIFIALSKIGSLCGLGGTRTFLLHEGTRTFSYMMEQFDNMRVPGYFSIFRQRFVRTILNAYSMASNVSTMEECITVSEVSPMHYDIAHNGT